MDALTKQQKIDLTVRTLVIAAEQHRLGAMGDRELMVMNMVCLEELQALDPEKASEFMARMTDGANR